MDFKGNAIIPLAVSSVATKPLLISTFELLREKFERAPLAEALLRRETSSLQGNSAALLAAATYTFPCRSNTMMKLDPFKLIVIGKTAIAELHMMVDKLKGKNGH